jgi:DNA-binding CsgD family transcriptional regulator
MLGRCEGARPPTPPGAWAGPSDELTPREHEIAVLAARGLSSREIADRLVVSVRTVDNTLLRAYRKLGISRRGELAGVVTRPLE